MSRFKVDSALRPSSGLYQKARGHTWYVKRSVPRDLQARLGGAFVRSTGTSDLRTAMLWRDEFYREWDELFARTRALGAGPDVTFEHLAAAVNAWKQKRCRFALAGPMHKRLWNIIDAIEGEIPDDHFEVLLDEQRLENAYAAGELPPSREQLSAQEYYEAHPEASRSLKTPFAVETLIRRLQDAAIHADDWRLVEGFDAALDQALLNGGIERPAPSELRPKLRLAFAAAWADVVQHEEMERLRAALQVAADAMTARTPDSLRLAPPVSEAAPPRTSKTVAQGIEHLRQVREVKGHGEADWKKLAAAYTTMIEIFGADRLLSTVEDTDAVAAVAMIQKVPWNQTKFWPGLPLADAIVAAEKVKARRLAPNTVNNYIVRMGQVFTALKLANPFAGLMTEGKKRVKRRAFTTAELKVIFESIVADRGDHAYYWLSALALYMGGRQNEFAQLYVADVKTYEGQRYLDLTLFDEDGLRSADKSLKTVESERVLPIHPALV